MLTTPSNSAQAPAGTAGSLMAMCMILLFACGEKANHQQVKQTDHRHLLVRSTALEAFGMLCHAFAVHAVSLETLEESVDIQRHLNPRNEARFAGTLSVLAHEYLYFGNHRAAERALKEALTLNAASVATRMAWANNLVDLSSIAIDHGSTTIAANYLKMAFPIIKELCAADDGLQGQLDNVLAALRKKRSSID